MKQKLLAIGAGIGLFAAGYLTCKVTNKPKIENIGRLDVITKSWYDAENGENKHTELYLALDVAPNEFRTSAYVTLKVNDIDQKLKP